MGMADTSQTLTVCLALCQVFVLTNLLNPHHHAKRWVRPYCSSFTDKKAVEGLWPPIQQCQSQILAGPEGL